MPITSMSILETSLQVCSGILEVDNDPTEDLVFDWCRGKEQSPQPKLDSPIIQHCPAQLKITGVLPSCTTVQDSAANRLISEVVQSRRRPLLGPSPG